MTGVAVLSILVHGLNMSGLLTRPGIASEPPDRTAYEIRSGRLQATAAALQEIDHMLLMRLAVPEILDALHEEYRGVVESTEQGLQKLAVSRQRMQNQELYRIRRRLLVIERDQVMQSSQQGALGRKSQERLLVGIDARLLRLETGDELGGSPQRSDGAADTP